MKDKPPRNKHEPPVAGAITWSQFLFRRLKKTITSFLKVPEMRESEHIKTVSHVFFAKFIRRTEGLKDCHTFSGFDKL